MSLTDILSTEHRVIEVLLNCLEKISADALKSGKLDSEAANKAIDVIRNFADKCHHGKEEGHLFPALISRGMPREGGPVGQMLIEHEMGRSFVRGMADSVIKAAAGD